MVIAIVGGNCKIYEYKLNFHCIESFLHDNMAQLNRSFECRKILHVVKLVGCCAIKETDIDISKKYIDIYRYIDIFLIFFWLFIVELKLSQQMLCMCD